MLICKLSSKGYCIGLEEFIKTQKTDWNVVGKEVMKALDQADAVYRRIKDDKSFGNMDIGVCIFMRDKKPYITSC